MSQLIQKAREIYKSVPVKELQSAGFSRDQWNYEFVSVYPPIKTHKPIKPEEIFSGEQKERVINFYVHIPFCTGRCGYCARYDVIPNPPEQFVTEYLDLLGKQADLLVSQRDLALAKTGHIYVGGGTPTYLSQNQLHGLARMLKTKFKIKDENEFTFEGSPETTTRDKLESLLKNGINRFSMGVQTYQDKLLQVANRRHSSSEAKNKANLINSFGFREFNIDLMTGLANQTLNDFEDDLNKSLENNPTSVTVYPMYVRLGCKFASFDRARFPSTEDWLLMQIMAREFFEERGYSQEPIHYFSRVEKQDKAYQDAKWKGLETLALGVSSYQFFNNVVFHNFFSREFGQFRGAIRNDRLPIGYGIKLNRDEQMAREIILAMKGSGKIDRKHFRERFEIFPEETNADIVRRLRNLGLILVNESSVKLTSVGELFSEEVARAFFTEEARKAIGNGGYMNFSIEQLPKL